MESIKYTKLFKSGHQAVQIVNKDMGITVQKERSENEETNCDKYLYTYVAFLTLSRFKLKCRTCQTQIFQF